MALIEAKSLTKWWKEEGSHLRKEDLPIQIKRYEDISIFMITIDAVKINTFDKQGRHKFIGYMLPRVVVEQLSHFLIEQEKKSTQ